MPEGVRAGLSKGWQVGPGHGQRLLRWVLAAAWGDGAGRGLTPVLRKPAGSFSGIQAAGAFLGLREERRWWK